MDTSDRFRCAALGLSTAALVLVPTLGPVLLGTSEEAEEFDTEITPPDYAFAIWAPIFLSSAAGTIQHLANPTAEANRRHGWWLAGAHTANAAWSAVAQSGRFTYTAAILPVAVGLTAQAHRRLQGPGPMDGVSIAPHSVGLLLGWTSIASVVNAFAVRRHGRLAPTTSTGRSVAAAAVLAGAGVLASAVATSRRGYVAIAAASGWGLATNALNRTRTPRTRAANALGACLLAATTLWRLRVRRAPSAHRW